MDRYTNFIIKHRRLIIGIFLLLAVICAGLSTLVGVNYSFADYLPDGASSTKALDVMEEEYDQAAANVRVMVYDVSISEALDYKKQIENVDGVKEVSWLDDAIDIYAPLETADSDTVDEWYKDKNALFSVTVSEDEPALSEAISGIRKVIGEENAMSGSAVTSALSPIHTSSDIQKIMYFVIPIMFVILILTTNSWFEPILFMVSIGVAILLNRGTNLMFGTISFVTNAAGSVLQLAVSMDYSIFLLHRFAENRGEGKEVKQAMTDAVKQSMSSILSSGLTTVTGFAALILMQFKIGPDMGWVMAKAIVLSLISVLCFLPALAISCYKLIDKTVHRPLYPNFRLLSYAIMRIRVPILTLVVLLLIPTYIAQGRNDFLYGGSKTYSTNQTQMGRDLLAIEKEYGTSNPLVVMVPKGDMSKEKALNDAFLDDEGVTSVISYVNSVGDSIPEEFVPDSQLSKLYSENYSRFILTVKTEEGEDGWEDDVENVISIAESYYGDEALVAGDLASSLDLKKTITKDNARVNLLAILFVVLILFINFRSVSLPLILTIVIEASIWINMAIPYLAGTTLHYIAYLIISSVQLGATIDYAILFTSRYIEFRETMEKKDAAEESIRTCFLSILTSSALLTTAGFLLGKISTNLVLSQLGTLIGRGAILSFVLVFTALPALLVIFDGLIQKTSYKYHFLNREGKKKKGAFANE